MVELDTSNGVMFPLYDPDANLIYLCGKVGTIGRDGTYLFHPKIFHPGLLILKVQGGYH